MKVESGRLEAYLNDTGASVGALVYGEDESLVRARARRLVLQLAGSQDDPFRICAIGRDMLKTLPGEVATPALGGGRRVVHVADASDSAAEPIRRAIEGPIASFLLVEAGGLTPRSKLRLLFEQHRLLMALACPALDQAAARRHLETAAAARQLRIDGETLDWLGARLPADVAGIDGLVDQMGLLVAPDRAVTADDAQSCLSGERSGGTDGLAAAMANGRVGDTDRALEAAWRDGTSPVAVVLGASVFLQQIHQGALLSRHGVPASALAQAVRPPVFGRRQGAFGAALRLWSVVRSRQALAVLRDCELACKQTGMPAEVLATRAILRVAAMASRNAVSGSGAR